MNIMWPVMIALAVYFTACLMLGFYARKKSEGATTREFLTANEGVGCWINGFAMFAAFSSGGAMLGNMGLGYANGWGYLVTLNTGTSCSMLIAAFLVAKPFRNMRLGTVPEFLRVRYDSKLLKIAVPVLLIVCMTIYMIAQMKITGMLGQEILGLPYVVGVFVVGAIYIFYTAIGGMWAISLTDFFQGMVMVFMLLMVGFFCMDFGNWDINWIYSTAQAIKPEFTTVSVPVISFIGGFLIWCCVQPCLPHTIMRVLSSKNEREGRGAFGIGIGLIAFSVVLTAILFMCVSVILNNGQPYENGDAAFIKVINDVLPPWAKAIAWTAIFAAVMSSISGMLLSLGAAVSYDLLRSIKPNIQDKTVRKLSSWFVVIFGVLAMILALDPPAFVLVLFSSAMGLLGSGLFWPILLGIWWRRMNKYGAAAGLFVGVTVYACAYFFTDMPSLSHMCVSLPASLAASVLVALLTPPSSEKEMERLSMAHLQECEVMEE